MTLGQRVTGRAQQPGGKTWASLAAVDDAPSWQAAALCRLEDAGRFTPDTRPAASELRALADICQNCPVITQCAAFALQNRLHGFYAGVWVKGHESGPARRALRRLSEALAMTDTGGGDVVA